MNSRRVVLGFNVATCDFPSTQSRTSLFHIPVACTAKWRTRKRLVALHKNGMVSANVDENTRGDVKRDLGGPAVDSIFSVKFSFYSSTMPDHLGKDQRKTTGDPDDDKPIQCKIKYDLN